MNYSFSTPHGVHRNTVDIHKKEKEQHYSMFVSAKKSVSNHTNFVENKLTSKTYSVFQLDTYFVQYAALHRYSSQILYQLILKNSYKQLFLLATIPEFTMRTIEVLFRYFSRKMHTVNYNGFIDFYE